MIIKQQIHIENLIQQNYNRYVKENKNKQNNREETKDV